MKVKQLMKKLQKCNPDADVILASDAEGNNYSRLCYIDSNDIFYDDTRTGSIELYDKEELKEYMVKNSKSCIVLYP